jgi:crossover junction endodeoxyribonuclease RuvC
MILLGIDPGISGGLAIVSTDTGRAPYVEEGTRTPSFKQGKHTLVDADDIFKWLTQWPIDQVVIEKTTSYGMGLATAYAFGKSCGSVEAIAQLACKRIEWVTPAVWKRHFKLSKDKQASLDLAHRCFGRSFQWDKKADDGIAEAALLCQWYLDKKVQ